MGYSSKELEVFKTQIELMPAGVKREQVEAAYQTIWKAHKDNALLGFRPHSAAQEEFFSSLNPMTLALAGNQFGKTCSLTVKALIQLVTKESLPDELLPYKKYDPPCYGRIVVPDYQTLETVVKPELKKWAPKGELYGGSFEKAWEKSLRMLRFKNESWIEFMCFRGDMRALLPDGTWKPVRELVEGDKVLTVHGPRKVTGTSKYDDAPLFKIRTRGGNEMISTPNHPHSSGGKWVRTDELKVGDVLDVMGATHHGTDTLERWELGWLAVMIGDGCTRAEATFFSANDDSPLLTELPPLPPNCHLRHQKNAGERVSSHFIASKTGRNPLKALLVREGLWGKYAREKFVPDVVFRQSLDAKADFLRWLWATDGCLIRSHRSAHYSTSSKRLAQDVKYLLWGFNLRASITEINHPPQGHNPNPHTQYEVRVSKAHWGAFNRMIGRAGEEPIEAEDGIPKQADGYIWSIERVENDAVYCVEVDEVHELIVDGVRTHNTYKQDLDQFGGARLHFVGYDEPPPQDIRNECAMRLVAKGGIEMFAMTPLKNNVAWVHRTIYKPWLKGELPYVTVVRGSGRDNETLDSETYERTLAMYPDEERKAREYGEFAYFGGVIYEGGFERCLIPEPTKEQVRPLRTLVGIDPGLRNAAFIWVGFDQDNIAFVYDEVLLQDKTPEDYAQAIRKVNEKWGVDPVYIIDPSARNRSLTNAESVEAELGRVGIHCAHGQNAVEAGIQQVRRRIQGDHLYVSEACRGLRDEAEEYHSEEGEELKVVKERDHHLDALRYALMNHPWWPETPQERKPAPLGVFEVGPYKPPQQAVGPLGQYA